MRLAAKQVMTRHFVSVNPETQINTALDLLLRHRISGLPVVESDNRLVGVISEFDLLVLLGNPGLGEDVVRNHLTRELITVFEDTPIAEVADLFLTRSIRRVPVVRGEEIVGLISRHDVLRFVRDVRQRVAQEMDARRHERVEAK